MATCFPASHFFQQTLVKKPAANIFSEKTQLVICRKAGRKLWLKAFRYAERRFAYSCVGKPPPKRLIQGGVPVGDKALENTSLCKGDGQLIVIPGRIVDNNPTLILVGRWGIN